VIRDRQKWCGCQKRKEKVVVQPKEAKVQQSNVWLGELESTAKEEVKEKDVRRMFNLREV